MPRTIKQQHRFPREDYELVAEFRYTLRRFLGFSETVALNAKVTPQQYQALLAIEGYPGRNQVTIGELAERLCTAHHSAVGLVDRMEALGLVRRARSKEDKRRVQVSLTGKGLGILETLYRVHREELKIIGPKLIGLLQKTAASASRSDRPREFSSPACLLPEIED